MSKQTIIIDGAGVSLTIGGTAVNDIVEVAFGVFGERQPIDLTTIDATKYKVKLFGDLQKLADVTITKKSDPVNDALLYATDSQALVLQYKIGKSTPKTMTEYVMVKSVSKSKVKRGSSDNVDVVCYVTNLDAIATMAETGPAITTPA